MLSDRASGEDEAHHAVPQSGRVSTRVPSVAGLRAARRRKQLLHNAAAQFNRKPKHGIAFLEQVGLIESPPTAAAIARFLRETPTLDRTKVGEYLGGSDDAFAKELRREFIRLFDFTGQPLLAALRMFLQSFRLPGESQQIDRIVQAFADAVHMCCTESQYFASVDVTYLLTFSIIMLNTDLHNANIREDRKMNVAGFIRNNHDYGADINHGRPLPDALLRHIFDEIRSHPIVPPLENLGDGDRLSADLWRDMLMRAAQADEGEPEGAVGDAAGGGGGSAESPPDEAHADPPVYQTGVDGLMLDEVWQPLTHALVCAFAAAANDAEAETTLRGILRCAQLAADHAIAGGVDYVVATLASQTKLLDPMAPAPKQDQAKAGSRAPSRLPALLAWGNNLRAQMATVAVFDVAHRHGAELRRGWAWLVHCLLRLHRLGLVPPELHAELHGEARLLAPSERAHFCTRLRQASSAAAAAAARSSQQSGGILSWLWGSQEAEEAPARHSDSDSDDGPDGDAEGAGESRAVLPQRAISLETGVAAVWRHLPEQGGAAGDFGELSGARGDVSVAPLPDSIPAWARHTAVVFAVECAQACRLDALIADSRLLPNESLVALETALADVAMGPDDAAVHDDAAGAADRSPARGAAGGEHQGPAGSSGDDANARKRGRSAGSDGAVSRHAPPASPPLRGVDAPASAVPSASLHGAAGGGEGDGGRPRLSLSAMRVPPPVGAHATLSVVTLRLLTCVTLRNRDRAAEVWPVVAARLSAVLRASRRVSLRLEAAAEGLLLLAARLLPRAELGARVVQSLSGFLELRPRVADALKAHVAVGVAALLRADAASVPSAGSWEVIFSLLESCALHNHAAVTAFGALQCLLVDPVLRAVVPVSAARPLAAFVRAECSGEAQSVAAVDLLARLHERLVALAPRVAEDAGAADDAGNSDGDAAPTRLTGWLGGWLPVLQGMRDGCVDPRASVRLHALGVLQTCLLDARLSLPAPVWFRLLDTLVFPLTSHLLKAAAMSTADGLVGKASAANAPSAAMSPMPPLTPRALQVPRADGAAQASPPSGARDAGDKASGYASLPVRALTPARLELSAHDEAVSPGRGDAVAAARATRGSGPRQSTRPERTLVAVSVRHAAPLRALHRRRAP